MNNYPRLRGGGDDSKGKGKGKGVKGKPSNAVQETSEGDRICFAYNTGGCNEGANGPFKRVCWIKGCSKPTCNHRQ